MGKVYLVGAGPGDPQLLTLKAYRLLQTADAVLYDALVSDEILELIPPSAERVFVGKRCGNHYKTQDEINRLIYRYSLLYPKVVRLKGGDPFLFGRGGEELLFLAERGVEVEVVPGISSVFGAAASAGIPLTLRGVSSSLLVVSGHRLEGIDWKTLASAETLVFLMGIGNRREIARRLIGAGRSPDEGVAFVENATTPLERRVYATLKEVAENPPEVGTPALFIVGSVVDVGIKTSFGRPLNLPTGGGIKRDI